MKLALLLLTVINLHAEVSSPPFEKVVTLNHGNVIVERYRANEGTEQIWLVSSRDPAIRHLLYTHHRQAEILFSNDDAWLAINDHCGSAGSSLLLYRRKDLTIYEKVADLTHAAWRFFDGHNGLTRDGTEANMFDHRYIDGVCWAGEEPPTLLIRLSGHVSGPAGIISASSGWYCLYDVPAKSFSTDLDTLNKRNTKR